MNKAVMAAEEILVNFLRFNNKDEANQCAILAQEMKIKALRKFGITSEFEDEVLKILKTY